MTVEQKTRL